MNWRSIRGTGYMQTWNTKIAEAGYGLIHRRQNVKAMCRNLALGHQQQPLSEKSATACRGMSLPRRSLFHCVPVNLQTIAMVVPRTGSTRWWTYKLVFRVKNTREICMKQTYMFTCIFLVLLVNTYKLFLCLFLISSCKYFFNGILVGLCRYFPAC